MAEKMEKVIVIQNPRGIHIRPSGDIAAALRGYEGKAFVVMEDGKCTEITASPLSIMALALRKGMVITVRVEGPKASSKLSELAELFSKCYDYT